MAKFDGSTWFRALWVRIAVTLFCVAWSCWEWFWNHDQNWGLITLGMTGWAIYSFFIKPPDKGSGSPPAGVPPPGP